MEFQSTELYGGAIKVDLPKNFIDASHLRDIPDHEELFIDAEGFTSIIIDITEHVAMPTESEAMETHLQDVVEEDRPATEVARLRQAPFAKLPNTMASMLIASTPPSERHHGRPNAPDVVGMVMIRATLAEQNSDVVITINVPHVPGYYNREEVDIQNGRYGTLMEQAIECRDRILATFEVVDWNLFNG
ncbi:Mog1p/PsbP-like protein [Piedraia hortae CBS 480.64]|uniref:Mog1p/PsbP-like protein n=1 Tax=Piedraia hortae CBS 480.64 TaxID=1314780 RepID=A0A6A7CAG0_9PEZI|nr:Mog1p/PsbP-like protein [Piedraia hortae CBS 480.64]